MAVIKLVMVVKTGRMPSLSLNSVSHLTQFAERDRVIMRVKLFMGRWRL